jgi:hypothetical protein
LDQSKSFGGEVLNPGLPLAKGAQSGAQ